MKRLCTIPLFLLLLAGNAWGADPVDYVRDVKPIFAKHCNSCHGPQKQRSGLRLDTAKAVLEGGNSGAVVIAGKSRESMLIQALTGVEGVKAMPPKELPRLPAEQVAILRNWVDQGAKAPATETVEGPGSKSSHWAFQPIRRSAKPVVSREGWVRNPIDYFILARLEREKIAPSPEADRPTLIRRVSLDLTGLPPTPAELEQVLNDKTQDWYEKYVDRLLASPHYGERMGRHWL